MKTIIETDEFTKQADKIWSEDERFDFFTYLLKNPIIGDVIPHTGGVRKVRWSTKGAGKRGGVRVIYLNQDVDGTITLLYIYKKNEKGNMTTKQIKKTIRS